MMEDFNPRTREGCDFSGDILPDAVLCISIHAPVKGATRFYGRGRPGYFYFNPRTREGCDVANYSSVNYLKAISIHAPVKGATWPRMMYGRPISNFNPRTREGCDQPFRGRNDEGSLFQSTHP